MKRVLPPGFTGKAKISIGDLMKPAKRNKEK